MKLIFLLFISLLLNSCGDDDSPAVASGSSPSTDPVTIILDSGAYKYSDQSVDRACSDYYTKTNVDGNYWIDPNGGSSSDAFIASCDMSGGGYTVIEKNFNYTTATNQTIEFFNASEISQLNSIRNISSEIEVTSDLAITFETDSSAGGCGGSPVIGASQMGATTLSLTDLSDNTETTREFKGSSDWEEMNFNNSTNEFSYSFTSDCGASTGFGVNEKMIFRSILLRTISSRGFSNLSGTFYKIKLK
ncbi:hypothetical protein BIY24_04125 [Halobacteriovorax marinus]|uniref:hypothetical protein n=1 Tax=Halobacteriovorax marinus TaxID=97084 RepID=UPI000BC353E1|nr:hypothetical protein [Halobacteriovorax marinus]ATH07152.1 hypothetical protein BIY24_04125 [Halobacteriovorax marinus]